MTAKTHENASKNPTVVLRPVQPQEEEFLISLYASTRIDEFSGLNWSEQQLDLFMRMQFTAQRQHYRFAYPLADDNLIQLNGQAVGRMLVDRSTTEILLVDIALLPQFRGRGLGEYLIRRLLAEAMDTGKAVRLTVLKTNQAAARLYQRLGFTFVADDEIYLGMICEPAAAKS